MIGDDSICVGDRNHDDYGFAKPEDEEKRKQELHARLKEWADKTVLAECPTCNGTRRHKDEQCYLCAGFGTVHPDLRLRVLEVRLTRRDWKDAEIERLTAEVARLKAERDELLPKADESDRPSIVKTLDELRAAGGDAWDGIADPKAYLDGEDE